jgi:hypothetical protein
MIVLKTHLLTIMGSANASETSSLMAIWPTRSLVDR